MSTEWTPTPEQLSLIERLSGLGLSVADIAARLNYGPTQFGAYIRTNENIALAMARGRSLKREEVAERLLEIGLEEGHVPALIWWEKSRYQMGETNTLALQGGEEGSPPIKTAPDVSFVRDVLAEIEKAHSLLHKTDLEGGD